MPRKMIVRPHDRGSDKNDEFVLEEAPADSEAQLQGILRSHPDLVPMEDFDLEGPLLIVGKETWLVSGAVDLMGVAKSGELVLVEFKTGPKNPDFRHALAQLLDYGSDLWGKSIEQFERLAVTYFASAHCEDSRYKNTTSLHEGAKVAWSGITQEKWEEARDKLAQQLRDGEMRYVLAAQRFTPSMEREIHYMNHLSKGARFYAAELVRFLGKDREGQVKEAFECRVVVRPERGGSTPGDRTNRTKLLEAVSEDRYREALERLLDDAEDRGFTFYWGAVGVSIRLKTPWQATPVSIAWLFPPRKAGFRGLTDFTLGYDQSIVNAGPDGVVPPSEPAFRKYEEQASLLTGAKEVPAVGIEGWRIPPEHLPNSIDKVREAWTTLVKSVEES